MKRKLIEQELPLEQLIFTLLLCFWGMKARILAFIDSTTNGGSQDFQ